MHTRGEAVWKWLHKPATICLIMGFALLLRIEDRVHHRNFYVDTQVQLAAAYNYNRGLGLSTCESNPANLSEILCLPDQDYAPGYAWLLALVDRITYDLVQASLLLDILAIFAFFVGMYVLFWRVMDEAFSRPHVLMALWMGMALIPAYYLPATDLWAMGLFSLAMAAFLNHFKGNPLSLWLAVLLLASVPYFRMAYFPLIATIPISLIGIGWIWQESRFLRGGIVTLGALGMLLLPWGGYQYSQFEQASYIYDQPGNWYPEHLLSFDPFPVKAFFFYGTPHELALEAIHPLLLGLLTGIAHLCSVGIMGYLGLSLLYHLRQSRSIQGVGIWIGAIIIGINSALLIYLSLTKPPESWNQIGFWTFVMETRYFVPAILVILVFVMVAAAQERRAWLRRVLLGFVLLSCVSNGIFQVYAHGMRYGKGKLADDFRYSGNSEIAEICRQLSEGGESVIFSSDTGNRVGEAGGAVSVSWGELIRQDTLFCSSPVTLLLWLSPEVAESKEVKNRISRYSLMEPAKRIGKGILFQLRLKGERASKK